MLPRVLRLVSGVVAIMVVVGVGTDATAEEVPAGHAHAASASQSELPENYAKLVAALDTMAAHDSAVVEAALKSGWPTLLVFLDRGCVECLRMIPVVDRLQKDFEATVEIVVVDTDDKAEGFRKLYRRFSIWTGPAFVVLNRSGKLVQRLIGPQPESSLRARLTVLTAESTPGPNQERRASHSPAPTAPSPHKASGTPTP